MVAGEMVVNADISGSHFDNHYAIQGPVILSDFNPREVLANLGIKVSELQDKQALTQSSLRFNLSASDNALELQDLNLRIDNAQLNGSAQLLSFVDPVIAIKLAADHLDVDRYLPPIKNRSVSKLLTPLAAMALASYALPVDLLGKLNVDLYTHV